MANGPSLPSLAPPVAGVGLPRPEWLKVRLHDNESYQEVRRMVEELQLHTVCQEARCPNIYECWAVERTATFMLLGDVCTRHCGFCAVAQGPPIAVDPAEPEHVAEAAARLGLQHAVVTSVNRDDLPDGGSRQFALTVEAIRRRLPSCRVEVLIPDFRGNREALEIVLDARPDVLNHNIETIERLYKRVRPDARYREWTLTLFERVREYGARTGTAVAAKSGLMVGLGETMDEVVATLADLRRTGVEIATVGQYLQPHPKRLPIARYWTPEEFAEIARRGKELGFRVIESGPFVRSSYHAKRALE